jgi:hypothetical protein
MTSKVKWLCLLLAPLAAPVMSADDTSDSDIVNPQVVEKLVAMGEYLRSLPAFQVNAAIDRDVVLDTGQKIKMQGTSEMEVEGRTRLRARLDTDQLSRQYFYNGKQLTQYSPRLKFYTTVDAPANLSDALHQMEDYYGLQLPMEDLFLFGRDQSQIDALKAAEYVGPSTVNGVLCDHLAFRQEGADWQLWITRSDKPLPCRLVITTTNDDSRPEYSATYRWNLKPTIRASDFTFSPGKGDTPIPLKKVSDEVAK